MCLTMVLFVVKYDSNEEMSIETMMGGDPDRLSRLYNSELYKKALKLWLPFLNKRGFLDTLIVEDTKAKKSDEGGKNVPS